MSETVARDPEAIKEIFSQPTALFKYYYS